MKRFKKNIPLKYLYILGSIVVMLLCIGLYYTYAMFTANVSSGNVVNMDTTLNYTFDISGTQSFHIGKNSVASFNFTINNSSSGAIYYEIYYNTSNDLTDVIIAEVVEDKTVITEALNTSGNIDMGASKNIPLVIANNSNNDIDVIIGVVSGYVGNTITYGTNNYPNGTKITSTYNLSDITNSCEAGTSVGENCKTEIENYYEVTYCETSRKLIKEDPSNANRPVLAEGMIPVTYNGSNWVKANQYGAYSDWYDYGNQKWANAVMVTSAKRDTYMSADVGTTVTESDILAYFVWIPRYKYKLFNASYASGTEAQLINVKFESGTETTGTVSCTYSSSGVESCQNKVNNNWYTHPAFTFGDTELSGIWVGKFEITGSTSTPTIKPGVKSLITITVSSMYNTSKLFNSTTYLTNTGTQNTDAHMMKNIEWGAVAYLKQSKYGLGITDIGINNNNNYKTGCGAASGSSSSSTCNTYNTTNGMLASTTGNVTGVYDMAGGAGEHVMGNYNKIAEDSGLTVSGIPTQYIDIYNGTSTSYSHLGDALGETAGWYSDDAYFVDENNPWFERGGGFSDGSAAGVLFFDYTSGANYIGIGFRVSLAITG